MKKKYKILLIIALCFYKNTTGQSKSTLRIGNPWTVVRLHSGSKTPNLVFSFIGAHIGSSWSPKGTYEEWYLQWFTSKSIFGNGSFSGDEIPDFHKKTYGEDFNYIDFAKIWKAELYDPQKWAELFKKSGAKYVVMTSKHHDGFALWPNKHTPPKAEGICGTAKKLAQCAIWWVTMSRPSKLQVSKQDCIIHFTSGIIRGIA